MRLDLDYQVAETHHNAYAVLTSPADAGGNACTARLGATNAASATLATTGPTLRFYAKALGVQNGTVLSAFRASTTAIAGPQELVQDVAPYDNQNVPGGAEPTTGLRAYTAQGPFGFLTIAARNGLDRFSVSGEDVVYRFDFFSHPSLSGDPIRVRFAAPPGWGVTPSRGQLGPEPEGQLQGGSGGEAREFSFTLSPTGTARVGDVLNTTMEAITASGGHVNVTTITRVVGERIESDEYRFTLLTPGPFKVGRTVELRFRLENATRPLPDLPLVLDIRKTGTPNVRHGLRPLPGGEYAANHSFPASGAYAAEVFLTTLRPQPHGVFTIEVTKSPGAPGFEVGLVLTAVAVGGWRHRQWPRTTIIA